MATIKLRRGTAANWTSTDPTLAEGEPAVETDTLKMKIGDGVTRWSLLPYQLTGTTYAELLVQLQGRGVAVSDPVFGAKGDGVTDDTAAIQAAINFAGTNGGGRVLLPQGTYLVTASLVVNNHNVYLVGEGSGFDENGAPEIRIAGTSRILFSATATADSVVKFTSVGGVLPKVGGGVVCLMIDGNNRATRCLDIRSWRGGQFEDLMLFAATSEMLYTGAISGTLSGTPYDTQFNRFVRVVTSARNQTTNTAIGARLTGGQGAGATVGGNTSFNQFIGCMFRAYNANVLVLEDTDNNTFLGCSAGRDTGTGYSLVLSSADQDSSGSSLAGRHARVNQFHSCQFVHGVYARAGQTGNSSSDANQFYGLNYSNGAPQVTYETPAGGSATPTCRVYSSTAAELLNATKVALAGNITDVATARTNIGTETVRIKNGSSNHVVLESGDGASSWSINMDGSGNLRFNRVTGTGVLQYNAGAGTLPLAVAAPQVTLVTAAGSGTWTKPANAVRVRVTAGGGGGGGGSGRRGAAGTVRCGGGGGGGGQVVVADFIASDLGSTEAYLVAAGGAGGAAVTTDDTSGNTGTSGGTTTFGTPSPQRWINAIGGAGGAGGTATNGTGAGGSTPGASVGQSASTTGLVGVNAQSTSRASIASGAGGASGGGITTGDATSAGGTGSIGYSTDQTSPAAGQPDGGTAAEAGKASRISSAAGGGGAGGGSSKTTAAGAGGNGARCSAGGGGGASLNGFASGAGGNGGDGFIMITTYFA